jgi:hypothetical protein
MKKTAVEWLVNEYSKCIDDSNVPFRLIDQAKQIEKEQMIGAFTEGMRCQNFDPNRGRAEQYFNETFKTNEK